MWRVFTFSVLFYGETKFLRVLFQGGMILQCLVYTLSNSSVPSDTFSRRHEYSQQLLCLVHQRIIGQFFGYFHMIRAPFEFLLIRFHRDRNVLIILMLWSSLHDWILRGADQRFVFIFAVLWLLQQAEFDVF